MQHLPLKHLTIESMGTKFLAPSDFETLMADKSVSRFVYALGDLAYSAAHDRDLYDLRRKIQNAAEQRRGSLTQYRCMDGEAFKPVGGAKFLYIFNKRKFLEEGE